MQPLSNRRPVARLRQKSPSGPGWARRGLANRQAERAGRGLDSGLQANVVGVVDPDFAGRSAIQPAGVGGAARGRNARAGEQCHLVAGGEGVVRNRALDIGAIGEAGAGSARGGYTGGGFHLIGTSSTGKTTALYVAGSVWGGRSNKGFLDTWKSTANGLEAVAQLHNHCLLLLDEINEVNPYEVGATVYALANGSGKSRMNKDTTSRRKAE